MHLWKQHYENLLEKRLKGADEPIPKIIFYQLDIKLGQFTHEEIDILLTIVKNRKAADLTKVWKTREFDDLQLRHCNTIYNEKTIDRLTKRCILSIANKGNLAITKNYRGIIVTFIAAKIYNALLPNSTELKVEKIHRKKNIMTS